MKKIFAAFIAVVMLVLAFVGTLGVSASGTDSYEFLFDLSVESNAFSNGSLIESKLKTEQNSVLSYDSTESALKVSWSGTGKAPARMIVKYTEDIKTADAPVIAVLVKPNNLEGMKQQFATQTSVTSGLKTANATYGETSSKVETNGVKHVKNAPAMYEVGNGYYLLVANVNNADYTYAMQGGERKDLIGGDITYKQTIVDFLPWGTTTQTEEDYYFVKSVALFDKVTTAAKYYGATLALDATAGYTENDDFVGFIDATDTNYVVLDEGGSWSVADVEGAMNGKALKCTTAASSADGDGFTVYFSVPTEGDYVIWSRSIYPDQSHNSLFYSIDGAKDDAWIWDFPDEDASDADCYGSWQYFYLTERKSGTYSDSALYGQWTIDEGQWRHSPNVLHLTAGQHSIKITGREANVCIDEIIVSSYSISEYDPNACTGNDKILTSCKFCGSSWQHYYSDCFAETCISAQALFAEAHAAAAISEMAVVLPTNGDDNSDDDGGDDGGDDDNTQNNEDDKNDTVSSADNAESVETEADAAVEEDKGCGSSISAVGAVTVLFVTGVSVAVTKKRKNNQ